jgi:hypothetical protein
MEKETPPSPPAAVSINYVDNPLAPDVFADEAVGFFVNNGVVKITFLSARVDHSAAPGPVNRVVIGRLALPVKTAQDLAVGLFDFLKSRGLAPALQDQSGGPLKAN